MSKSTVVMLQMMATMQTEEKIVNEAIEALLAYKASGFQENQPFAQIMMCVIKWEQGNDANPIEVMERAMKDQAIVTKAVEIHDELHPEDKYEHHVIGKERKNSDDNNDDGDDEIKVKVFPMGEPGKA